MDDQPLSVLRSNAAWPPRPNLSCSSMRAFARCRRAWLLRYAAPLLPEGMRADARLEAHLAPIATLAGTVVDAAITNALYRWHRLNERPKDLLPAAKAILHDIHVNSIEWAAAAHVGCPPPRTRYQPLERDYYSDGWTERQEAQVMETIETCLANFAECGFLDALDTYPRGAWRLPPRDLCPWFRWDGVPVFAKYDFAIRAAEEVFIIDWKTGINRSGVLEQMHLYAAYAMAEWFAPIQTIRLMPVWLRSGEVECHDVSAAALEATRRVVVQRHRTLAESLEAARDRPALEVFPITAELSACKGCTFRSCPGYGREAPPRGNTCVHRVLASTEDAR